MFKNVGIYIPNTPLFHTTLVGFSQMTRPGGQGQVDQRHKLGCQQWIFMSNEKTSWSFVGYMSRNTRLCGDYFINHEIRIPLLNNQFFSWNVGGCVFFSTDIFFASVKPSGSQIHGNAYRQEWKGALNKTC